MHCTTNHITYPFNDTKLLERAQQDENTNFDMLFNCYRSLVHRLWQKYYVAGLEAEDWDQEARLVLVRVLRAYHGDSMGQFSGFYKQSLTNRILDLYRARQAHKRIPADQLFSLGEIQIGQLSASQADLPEEQVYCRKCLARFIKACSPFELQVVILIHRGNEPKEVAACLKCSERKVRGALTRGRQKLRNELLRV